jgi:hypothetical protein
MYWWITLIGSEREAEQYRYKIRIEGEVKSTLFPEVRNLQRLLGHLVYAFLVSGIRLKPL